jgi:hypothetical protein
MALGGNCAVYGKKTPEIRPKKVAILGARLCPMPARGSQHYTLALVDLQQTIAVKHLEGPAAPEQFETLATVAV